ncbi:MAG: pyridoxamine 5'-phosphate oxidase family protein [Candidatus Omnitrophica bacterium]|nr:pyridoxamine 5'-phosphate oxidase family protein [Candidatus Omnitrophota bacterium]
MSEGWQGLLGLVASCREASLATLEEKRPYVSVTGYVLSQPDDLRVAVLLSSLARHTRNIRNRPDVSLLIVEEAQNLPVHEKSRITLMGAAAAVEDAARTAQLKDAYLDRFPRAQSFFSLPDFRFYEIVPDEIHWIGGFGKAGTWVRRENGWQELTKEARR